MEIERIPGKKQPRGRSAASGPETPSPRPRSRAAGKTGRTGAKRTAAPKRTAPKRASAKRAASAPKTQAPKRTAPKHKARGAKGTATKHPTTAGGTTRAKRSAPTRGAAKRRPAVRAGTPVTSGATGAHPLTSETTRAMESGPGEDKGGRADERTGGMAGEAELPNEYN